MSDTKLIDTSLMPFGIHKGKTMANVPAEYLLWFWREGVGFPEVRQYIRENMDVIKMEFERERKKYGMRKEQSQ